MKRHLHLLCMCAFLTFVGCIDRDFDLADVSGEVTVGGEELVVPLADINRITLDNLLGEQEGITTDENGTYTIMFSSFGDDPTKYEKVSIDGISIPNITGLSPKLDPITFSFGSLPTSLLFSAIEKEFDIDIPTTIGDVMEIVPIKVNQPIELSLPSQISDQGVIDDRTYAILKAMNLTTITSKGESEAVFDASLTILEQLEKIDWVEFGCEDHPLGAPFHLKMEFNGLYDIIGGGEIEININFPEGYYLRDKNGRDLPTATHNIFKEKVAISAGQREVDFLLYLHKIDYSDHTFTNGELKIDDHIKFSYDINLDIRKGSYNLYSKPQFVIDSEPQYKDVEVKINHFELPKQEYAITHTFNGMPNGVMVEKVAFSQNSNLTVSLKGLEWCVVQDNLTDADISPKIEIDMPLCIHFREHPLLDEATNVLLASTKELAQGVTLSLDYIDCKNSAGIKQEDGQLIINEKIGAAVHMESLDGHTVLVSTITPPKDFSVVMGIAESRLEIDAANSVVTWSDDKSFDFDFKDNIPTIAQTIEIPEMIAEIKCIEIGKANSNEPLSMNFTLDAGNKFPINELELSVSVNLGKLLRPTQKMFNQNIIYKNDNGDYILAINESWKPKEGALTKTLEFEALENIPEITDGKITINQSFPVTGSAKIKSGENIDLAVDNASIDIDITIDDIEVRTFTGKVDINLEPESMMMDLGLGELEGIEVGALSLNPVLTLRLKDNPTGVGLNADVDIKTYDKDNNPITTISIPTITIAGNGGTTLVISTPRNAEKYDTEGVEFIAIENLSQLLKSMPEKVGVDLAVASNKDEEITIDLKKAAQGYDIEYQYEVLLPFEFDGNIDLSMEASISGLSETFNEIADTTNGLKVGDVGLIAEFGTTIPFNVVLSAELVNDKGTSEGIAARLNINNCVLEGYNKERDGEKRISNIDLDFDLGESGSLEGLKGADGIRFKLAIYDTGAASATLAKDQYIDGKLKLRLRNGVSIDIFDFLNKQSEEE